MSIAHLIDRAGTMPDGQQVTVAGLNYEWTVAYRRAILGRSSPSRIWKAPSSACSSARYEAAAQNWRSIVVQIRGQVERRDETVSLRATEFQVPTLEAEDEAARDHAAAGCTEP